MDAVKSIFAQMRKTRELAAIAEAEEEKEKGEVLNEGAEEVPAEEVVPVVESVEEPAPAEEPVNPTSAEEPALDEAEEFVVIKCHDCGAILSALDEAEEGCPVCGSEDLDEKTVKVVKEGKVVKKNVATRKKKLSAAQKAALAKARKKAHTAGAAKKRAKSNAVREKKGMNEEETITCPECNYEGQYDDFDVEDGNLICPDCGAVIEMSGEED